MLKVLLVSPIDPDIPGNLKFLMGGENTYTRTLLSNPPKGVKYIHHLEALEKGLIKYLSIHKILNHLMKFRILPPSSGVQAIFLKSSFDLIHVHAYGLKIVSSSKRRIPIIMSDSSSNYLFLRDYLNWPSWRIKLGLNLKKFLFEKLEIADSDTSLRPVKKLMVFSKFAAKVHQDLGISKNKIEVIYPGLPGRKAKIKTNKNFVNILFVGVWFERKGGHILFEAFKNLNQRYPNIRLSILGPVPEKYKLKGHNIFQKDFVSYQELLENYYPQTDVIVLVPLKAEGYGFVVEEAASFGIPAVVSRVYALPEIVKDGKTGFVVKPGSVEELVDKLEFLIKDQKLRRMFGEAALKKFNQQFAIEKSNEKLLKVYHEVVAA